jgi:hypothetical protein
MMGDGGSNEHKRVMKEKWLAYAMPIRNSTLQRGECSMAYGAYYLPSLVYDTPTTTLSYKECEDVQRAVVAAISKLLRPRTRSPGNHSKLLSLTVPHQSYQEQKHH